MVNNLPKATGLEHSRARIQTWNLEPAWLQENAVTALNKLRASWREIECTQMCLQPKWLCRKSRGQECSGRENTWLSGSKRVLRRVGWELGLKKWGHIILLGKKSKDILGRRNKSEQEMKANIRHVWRTVLLCFSKEMWQRPWRLDSTEAKRDSEGPNQLIVQFSSVTQWGLTLCDPMDCGTPGLPVHHQLLELAQTHVPQVGDIIQPSHALSSPSPHTFNLSQHRGLFQWVSSLY